MVSETNDEDSPHSSVPVLGRRKRENALKLGPRKKPCTSHPLVHSGRHFGRTVHALCNVNSLITNGVLRMGELADQPEETFTAEERREHRVFQALLNIVPGLEESLLNSSTEETRMIGDLIQKGVSSARSDDTKSLKGAIVDWIAPPGQSLVPPISRNIKRERGFHHDQTGALLCPAGLDWSDEQIKADLRNGDCIVSGDQWPLLLYKDYVYNPEDPWAGLLRSSILVKTFKHIFTSPSSAEQEAKATRSGNARIHGMTRVTYGSLAYVATQARFALTSSPTFTRSDTVTDSERFYNSILDYLEDPDEREEVNSLMLWWNRQVFPSYSSAKRIISKNSALAHMRERRAALKAQQNNQSDT